WGPAAPASRSSSRPRQSPPPKRKSGKRRNAPRGMSVTCLPGAGQVAIHQLAETAAVRGIAQLQRFDIVILIATTTRSRGDGILVHEAQGCVIKLFRIQQSRTCHVFLL